MVCSKCQTAYNDQTLGTCSTCGAELTDENELATRFAPSSELAANNGPESDLSTGFTGKPDAFPADAGPPLAGLSRVQGWTSAVPADAANGALCLMPGLVLGNRYEILKELGEGGMGSVYKARDLEVNRFVAIKIIRQELANDPVVIQRFKQELVLARQVTHRNVVRIFDLGVAGGLRFISMEYIEGRDLSDVLRERGKFDPKTASDIILQVCRGLEAAHSQGVIHRDLKPQNIMLDGQGRAAVMDFGIARSAELEVPQDSTAGTAGTGRAELTQFGALLGTPRYMSPEQALGRPVGPSSDMFTVGIIFYELLTGQLPFKASNLKELLRSRSTDKVVPITEVDPTLPKRLNEIICKCLASRPEDRYQSASELIVDLEVWLGIRNPAGARMSRWTAVGFALALVAILLSAYFYREHASINATKTHRPVTVLISDFKNATGNPLLSGVVEPMLQVALEGASFVSAFNRGQAHKLAAEIRPGTTLLDEHLGRLVAIREGIGVIVGGGIEAQGNGYRLSANSMDAGGKVLLSEGSDFGQPNELPKAVDTVATRIRRKLGDSTHSTADLAAETFTSGSLESAQKYALAQQLQWDGKWTEAVAAYREATVLDPKMSRAYAGMAATLANEGKRQQAEHYYELALKHIDRESEREKFRTRGGYYLLMRNYQKAAQQFGELVKQYPVDTAGLGNLALAYFYGRNMSAALEQGRKAVAIYPQNILQRNNVGLYAMYAGDFDAAIKESEDILRMNPSFEKAYLCLGISQLQSGSAKAAQQTFETLSKLSDWGSSEASLALGDLAIYEGRDNDAIRLLGKGAAADLDQKNEGPAAVKLVALASAQLENKQRSLALKNAVKAVALTDDESVLFGAATVETDAGDTSGALALAKKLDTRFEPEPRALSKLIEGEVEMKGGKLHEAVASIEGAQQLADTWLGRYDLGRAYLAAKLYPEAENEFDVCLKRRGEASAAFLDDEPTVRFVPPIYYYLGVARDGLHSPGAAGDFKTFLAIKQSSEPNAMLADAKRRLQTQQ